MAIVLAYIHRSGDAYGVSFPNYPGVAAGGGSVEEALSRGRDGLASHFEAMLAEGLEIPPPSSFVVHDEVEPDFVGSSYVDVPIPSKALRINISMDEDLLGKVDRAAKAAGESRSAFLARAARERLAG
jgi:predicted RNase H-like HicB family nuclease